MLGLFGTLNLGTRSLQTQRAGVEVAGQNLANVNNPSYARQRVIVSPSVTINSSFGPQGTGADAIAIQQIRNTFVDSQISAETSVAGYLEAQQTALEYAQSGLGDSIETAAAGTTAETAVGTGISGEISDLFAAFQSVAASPSSVTERQLLISRAQTFTGHMNAASGRITELKGSLNTSLGNDVTAANKLLSEIADLNDRVRNAENVSGGVANDLRDMRQEKIEELSKLVKVDASTQPNGEVNLSVNGQSLVAGKTVQDTLETYDAGSGQMMVRTAGSATPLALGGGHMQGLIDVRDGALTDLQKNLDDLASAFIGEVNAVHATGYGLDGNTGLDFFTGTNAATIGVNATLAGDPRMIQISGVAGSAGDNTVGLALADLSQKKMAGLSNLTVSQDYSATVAYLGQALDSVNSKIADQQVVQKLLLGQRDSVSGVSIDEEMTDMMKYQKAFEASAKLITTVDDMLDTLVNMKR